METAPGQPNQPQSLLDEIAHDPAFINRGARQAQVPVAPATSAVPAASRLVPEQPVTPMLPDRDGQRRSSDVNLLQPRDPQPVAPKAVPAPEVRPRPHHRGMAVAAVLALVFLLASAGAWWYVFGRPTPPLATASPSPTPVVSSAASPSPTAMSTPSPTPTPTPPPSPTPAPQTVTAPVVTPTADHPQAVTVTSPSGLWLRSSPTSVNRSNIIGWMPHGATIQVDQVGSFWWHGSYQGKPGYFAVTYTQ